jgi:hypothetical protein
MIFSESVKILTNFLPILLSFFQTIFPLVFHKFHESYIDLLWTDNFIIFMGGIQISYFLNQIVNSNYSKSKSKPNLPTKKKKKKKT